jgi:hypothetical protein
MSVLQPYEACSSSQSPCQILSKPLYFTMLAKTLFVLEALKVFKDHKSMCLTGACHLEGCLGNYFHIPAPASSLVTCLYAQPLIHHRFRSYRLVCPSRLVRLVGLWQPSRSRRPLRNPGAKTERQII